MQLLSLFAHAIIPKLHSKAHDYLYKFARLVSFYNSYSFYASLHLWIKFQCKDSYLTPESFSAAIADGSSNLELRTLQFKIQGEIKKLQKTGVTG